jgi:hypothetical protein
MNRTLHAPALTLIAALAVSLAAGPAQARSPEAQADTQAPNADDLTTGSVAPDKKKRRLEDCMAIWEPATHMSKKEWRRTCDRQLDESPDL